VRVFILIGKDNNNSEYLGRGIACVDLFYSGMQYLNVNMYRLECEPAINILGNHVSDCKID